MRLIICDDHPVYRDGLRLMLTELGFEVVAEAATGEEAVELTAALAPTLVMMDLHLPGISGIEATRQITAADPTIGVLVLTMLDDDQAVFAALRAGARGYLLKGAQIDDVARAVESVARGDAVLAAAVASRLRYAVTGAAAHPAFPELTSREAEVLDLMARGRSNDQIARALFLSVKTVRNNVSAVLGKLGVGTRGEAIARARDADVGGGPDR